MKSTDEMILDLVAARFVLPEGLGLNTVGKFWRVRGEPHAICGFEPIPDQQAYDLCALEFARQAYKRKGESEQMFGARLDCVTALAKGDSAAAIKALWEACGGTNES